MPNLTEASSFDAGVYQIETTDAILGGAGQIANAQAQALANRTKYLKAQTDALNAAMPTKAPLDSPAFVNLPTAPTADDTANNSLLATTAFARNVLAKFGIGTTDLVDYTGDLNALYESGIYLATGINIPVGGSAAMVLVMTNVSNYSVQIAVTQITSDIYVRASNAGVWGAWSKKAPLLSPVFKAIGGSEGGEIQFELPATGHTLSGGVAIELVGNFLRFAETGGTVRGAYIDLTTCVASISTKIWHAGLGANTTNTNGYMKLPNGIIIQWGLVNNVASGSEVTINFPLAFPTACRNASVTRFSSSSANTMYAWVVYSVPTTTQLTLTNGTGDALGDAYWMAIGY